jgi:tetratricopeptide (TPR) repeat protein
MINTSISQKLCLILIGIFIGILFLESSMRVAGFFIQVGNLKSQTFENNKKGSDFVILTLGESTTEYLGKESWPEQLEKILNNKSSKLKVRIINKARSGTNSAVLLSHLRAYIEEYKPDMVITMMGINDDWSYVFFADKPPNKIELFFQDFRIVKLARLIYLSFKQKESSKKINIQDMPEEAVIHFTLGLQFFSKGDMINAKTEIEKAINLYPFFYDAYVHLGLIERDYYKNMTKAIEYFEYAVKINPYNSVALARLGETIRESNPIESQKLLTKALTLDNAEKELILNSLIYSYEKQNYSKEIDTILGKEGLSINLSDGRMKEGNTKYHYRLMYKILEEKNITWAIMQYPTRDILDFKDFFSEEEQDKLIFIENKENFIEALKNLTYEELFRDKFAFPRYSFGHCTEFGNKLITENVANAIFDKIKKRN